MISELLKTASEDAENEAKLAFVYEVMEDKEIGQEVTEEVDLTKVKIEDLDISKRSQNALVEAGIKSVAGLVRKNEQDLLEIDGIAEKGVEEIKLALAKFSVSLKD